MASFQFGNSGGGASFNFGGGTPAATTTPATAAQSFSFGQAAPQQKTAGFTFGTPTAAPNAAVPAQPAPVPSFSFGGGGGPAAAPSTASAAPQTSSGFGFGGAGAGVGGGTGFSFGAQKPVGTATATPALPLGGAPAAGFSFGTPPPQRPPATTATANTGLQLGGGTPGGATFSFGTPQKPAATAAPALPLAGNTTAGGTGFGFGQAPAAPAASISTTTTQQGGTGFGFGQAPAAPAAAISTTTTQQGVAAGFTLGGPTLGPPAPKTTPGFGTFSQAAVPQAAIQPTSTSVVAPAVGGLALGGMTGAPQIGVTKPLAATPTGGLTLGSAHTLGGLTQTKTLQQQPTATAAPNLTLGGTNTAAVGPTLGQTLGQTLATSTAAGGIKLDGPTLGGNTASTVSTSLTLGGPAKTTAGFALTTATTQASLASTTSTTSSTATVQSMNYRQLEEAINKWTLELEEQEKVFLEQATEVNAWDRLLIDNGEKITQLNTDVDRVKIDQQRLDQELDFILAQQRELEELLTPLETAMEALPPVSYQQHADLERENTYKMAENIDAQLKRMAQDLKEIIEHLNASNSAPDSVDPVAQIAKILNAHMDSLQWVDQNTALLQRRVEDVSRQSDQQRKEQERNFRLAYN